MGRTRLFWIGLAVGVAARWLHPAGKRPGWTAAPVAGEFGVLPGYYSDQLAHLYADGQTIAQTAAVVGATLLPVA